MWIPHLALEELPSLTVFFESIKLTERNEVSKFVFLHLPRNNHRKSMPAFSLTRPKRSRRSQRALTVP